MRFPFGIGGTRKRHGYRNGYLRCKISQGHMFSIYQRFPRKAGIFSKRDMAAGRIRRTAEIKVVIRAFRFITKASAQKTEALKMINSALQLLFQVNTAGKHIISFRVFSFY